VVDKENLVAHFHPFWSNGTAAIRANKPINRERCKYYWETLVKDRLFGTSMMFGVSTRSARLHCNSFVNLIGEDEFGWGLSHKGLIWHNSQWKAYTKPFRENRSTLIGCMYDGLEGTLTFYKDGASLGVAFTGLNLVEDSLYPTISSTAAKTEFKITFAMREFCNLQERCRFTIRKQVTTEQLSQLNLPTRIVSFLKMEEDELKEFRRFPEHEEQPEPEKKELIDQEMSCWPSISLTELGFQSKQIPMPDL